MEKITPTIIKAFVTEKEAEKYAKERKGRVEISYDYDNFRREIRKTFLVKVKI